MLGLPYVYYWYLPRRFFLGESGTYEYIQIPRKSENIETSRDFDFPGIVETLRNRYNE